MEPLSIADAARLAGVDTRTLRRRVARGTVASVTIAGRKCVERAELERAYPRVRVVGSEPAPAPTLQNCAECARLRETVARLEGSLSMSERVEASAQRAADRIEAQLAEAKREHAARLAVAEREKLSIARQLGHVEGERDTIRAQLSAPRSRPWWRFGR